MAHPAAGSPHRATVPCLLRLGLVFFPFCSAETLELEVLFRAATLTAVFSRRNGTRAIRGNWDYQNQNIGKHLRFAARVPSN